MQSLNRKIKRINAGLQNPAPSSTKISKHTEAKELGDHYGCFRVGRFVKRALDLPGKFIRNMSTKTFLERAIA